MDKLNITFLSLDIDALIDVKNLIGKESSSLKFNYICKKLDEDLINAYDTVVSPANSYGELKGGVDYYYYRYLGGDELQKKIYKQLSDEYYGEIPIGSSMLVKVDDKPTKHIIMCPTMTIPMNVDGTRNAYLFMKALLKTLQDNYEECKFNNILVPLPCIGVGGMDYGLMAKQIKVAIQAFENCGIIRAIHMNESNEKILRRNSGGIPEYQTNNVLQNAKMAFVQLCKK
jgi:O-acetyl-ADP-ribose deacetylase (regulator of RNase III)